ncbi:MAG: class I tRNA ligase family protein [Anaerolineae bacterium]
MTTAIPYVNARPHIGFALEAVIADALARYHRLKGDDVLFLTGTDENSLKNVQAAEEEGIPTADLVERNSAAFRGLGPALNLSFDDFIRTSCEERHLLGAEKLWRSIDARGDLYKRDYEGLYCVGCEQFYAASELEDGLCPEHQTPPEPVAEGNWFFRLSRYTQALLDRIESGDLAIVPDNRRNEVLSFIRMGLEDFRVARSRERAHGWGIPVPGDPDQVMYVWFDALGNYITALDYAGEGPLYRRYWTENPNRVHVIGKGITRFHAIYWPAMLLSAGVPLPTTIFVHGYVTVGGQKISKSLGNVIDPYALAGEYGADALRYFLLRHIRSTEDGDFTTLRFMRAYNADLANQLGNLLNRTVSMIGKYAGGVVPEPGPAAPADAPLVDAGRGLAGDVEAAMGAFATHRALARVWDLVDKANKYVVVAEPWVLAKARSAGGDDGRRASERLATVLYNLAEALRLVGLFASPFVPASAAALREQLGVGETVAPWDQLSAWGGLRPGTEVRPDGVLFPRLEVEPGEDN